jgi:lysozyme family protein
MCDFANFLKKLLKLEGGYVNHPNDKGGCTNKGITIETFRNFYGENLTCSDLKNITDEQVEAIYKDSYWDPCWGDKIQCPKIAQLIADWAVNSGVKTAIKGVQKIVGVTNDGIMGPMTLKAINEYPTKDLFDALKKARKEFYERIVEKNPSQSCFLKGWLNRLNEYEWCE